MRIYLLLAFMAAFGPVVINGRSENGSEQCPAGSTYQTCGGCQRDCSNFLDFMRCTTECKRGCFCDKDTTWSDATRTQCVPTWDCLKPSISTNVNACAAYPCQNGGTCTDAASGASDASGRSCACRDGFSGVSCEIDVNACTSYPCQNGGTCTDAASGASGASGRSCACGDGFSGVSCEIGKLTVEQGLCTVSPEGDCLLSPNYPQPYNNNDRCRITATRSGILTALEFTIEECCDFFYVGNQHWLPEYPGATIAVASGTELRFLSDTRVAHQGFYMCLFTLE